MPNRANINPAPDQKVLRNIGRVRTLRTAIAKAHARGNAEREANLQAELDRRLAEVNVLKAELDAL